MRKKKEEFELSARDWSEFRNRCETFYNNNNDGVLTVSVQSSSNKRSSKQNKYYWSVVIGKALGYYKENVRALIEDVLKALKFNVTRSFVHELFKMRFNGGRSTAKLDTKEMTEYWDKIREDFLDKGVDIPPPNEPEIEELVFNNNGE